MLAEVIVGLILVAVVVAVAFVVITRRDLKPGATGGAAVMTAPGTGTKETSP